MTETPIVFNERWRADRADYILTVAALALLPISPIGAIAISSLELLRFKLSASAAKEHKMTNQSIALFRDAFNIGKNLK